jgi:crotonobetainyl-CoA:carnitine CoA-transferase CaiB-like acyl-CoA transferase
MIFKDLKIVELSSVLAGPAVGMFFAELGAEVIKIENKNTGGDVTRSWKNTKENSISDSSAYYTSINHGKTSVLLDFNSSDDIHKAHQFIAKADIVLTNFPKATALKFQMDVDTLFKINNTLIIGEINGYGENDERVAYDLLLQAETGYLSMTGYSEDMPAKMPVAFIDILAAHQMKEAILIALLLQKENKIGKHITVSLFDTAIASLTNQASNYLMTNLIPKPLGSLHPNIAPYGEIFITKDNKKTITAIGSDRQFEAFCMMINGQEILTKSQYKTNAESRNSETYYKFRSRIFTSSSSNI